MVNLKQKTALVTGGSRGIGRAIVERLAADGADVVFSYLSNEAAAAEVAAAVTAAGGTAHAVRADLGEPGAGQALYERAEELLGPLDILVNNAGVAPRGVIADTSDEDFGAVLAVNLNSPFSLIREAARRMRDGGRIINVSTLNTVLAGPGMAPMPPARPRSSCSAGWPRSSSARAGSPSIPSCRAPRIPTCGAPTTPTSTAGTR
jgi:3-oxoacyl-[acyl-carrier protein] reductase